MELETTVTEIGSTVFVRIPPAFVEYFRLKGRNGAKVKITEINPQEANITFSLW